MIKLKLMLLVVSISILGSFTSYKSLSKNKNWLQGNWIGLGYQIDIKEDNQWTIQLEANTEKNSYKISYPSLNCSGKWKLIKYSGNQAIFKEVIEHNTYDCIPEGIVILNKVDNKHILYSYFYKDDKKASAFSTLEKSKLLFSN